MLRHMGKPRLALKPDQYSYRPLFNPSLRGAHRYTYLFMRQPVLQINPSSLGEMELVCNGMRKYKSEHLISQD